jgi:uroporphyrinogen-III synthase
LALDAKVITYWHDHGIDLLILTSIAAVENLYILLKIETKPWFCEAAIVSVSNWIEHEYRAFGYAGHNALLKAIHTH